MAKETAIIIFVVLILGSWVAIEAYSIATCGFWETFFLPSAIFMSEQC